MKDGKRTTPPAKRSHTFLVTISDYIEMTVEDIWPDGDGPENPTDEDVATAMREYGSKQRVLRDWELLNDVTVSVGDVDVW